jgi:hypothetical protein
MLSYEFGLDLHDQILTQNFTAKSLLINHSGTDKPCIVPPSILTYYGAPCFYKKNSLLSVSWTDVFELWTTEFEIFREENLSFMSEMNAKNAAISETLNSFSRSSLVFQELVSFLSKLFGHCLSGSDQNFAYILLAFALHFLAT